VPGTIDPDYIGEWGVLVLNASGTDVRITHGDRIAQMVIARFETLPFDPGVVVGPPNAKAASGSTERAVSAHRHMRARTSFPSRSSPRSRSARTRSMAVDAHHVPGASSASAFHRSSPNATSTVALGSRYPCRRCLGYRGAIANTRAWLIAIAASRAFSEASQARGC
jgi:hypothetical protein